MGCVLSALTWEASHTGDELVALAAASEEVVSAAVSVRTGARIRSLRDVVFLWRRDLPCQALRLLRDIQLAYSLFRHLGRVGVRQEAARVALLLSGVHHNVCGLSREISGECGAADGDGEGDSSSRSPIGRSEDRERHGGGDDDSEAASSARSPKGMSTESEGSHGGLCVDEDAHGP